MNFDRCAAQVERVEHFPSSSVETIPLSDPLWKPSTLAAPMAPPAAVPGTAIAEAEAPSQAVPGLVPGYHSLTWWQLRVAGPDDGCFLTCRATVDARNDAPIEEKTIRLSVLGIFLLESTNGEISWKWTRILLVCLSWRIQ